MKIALIYNKESEVTTAAYFERVLKEKDFEYTHFHAKDAQNIPKTFDLYLRMDHGDYKYDIPQDLKPSVFYAIDTHLKKPYKKIREQAKHYDVVFCCHKQDVARIRKDCKVDAHWLPVACEPQITDAKEVEKKYDIGFVGRDAEKFQRGKWLSLLREKYPNSHIGEADFREMGSIYSASKIGFNASVAGDVNMRFFEVMSSGCFLLTNDTRGTNNGFEDMFEVGKHLITYKNTQELLELVDYYLNHEKERERIARAGYEYVHKHHTYLHRVQTLFNYLAFKWGGSFNSLRI